MNYDEEEQILVHEPGEWNNEDGPKGWYAISNEDGIFAYASTLEMATAIKLMAEPGQGKELPSEEEYPND